MFRLKQYTKQEKQNYHNNKSFYSLIPLHIYQTWYTLDLPDKMRKNVEELKRDNPEFKHYLYDDKMCRDFIKSNFNEEVLWAFDKLKPGAYKADLWRYCILYINGGIYLDIKFKCIDNFRLIELTEQEYWVKDIKRVINGIYQALMVTFPRNNILWKAIQEIVINCKNNLYSLNTLAVSGPTLLGQYFNEIDFNNLSLKNMGDIIVKNDVPILQHYNEYRNEQKQKQKTSHYDFLWNMVDIFNYLILKPKNTLNISDKKDSIVNNNTITYFSSIPNIVEKDDLLYVYTEYCNECFHTNGIKNIVNTKEKTKFNIRKYDYDLKKKDSDIDFSFDEKTAHNLLVINFNNAIYYITEHFNTRLNRLYFSSNKLDINDDIITFNYINEKQYRQPDAIYNNPVSFVNINDELVFIYNWYPLQLGTIDFEITRIKINNILYNVPSFFKNIKNASYGVTIKDEIWFILNINQTNYFNESFIQNNKHLFAVFDLQMNFKQYSELFSFADEKNEFCKSFIYKDDELIIGYGVSNKECYIAKYDFKDLCRSIRWFNE